MMDVYEIWVCKLYDLIIISNICPSLFLSPPLSSFSPSTLSLQVSDGTTMSAESEKLNQALGQHYDMMHVNSGALHLSPSPFPLSPLLPSP
jgi:hypothetical protein